MNVRIHICIAACGLILTTMSVNKSAAVSFDLPGSSPLQSSLSEVDTLASSEMTTQDEEERFQSGLDLYRDAQYDSAAVFFSEIDTPEARLFAGKSYFAISYYPLAKNYLRKINRDDDPRIYDEARFTLALADFQTGQIGRSLDILYDLKSRPAYQNLHEDAESMYEQILGYLTTEQRKTAFEQSVSSPVQFDIFRYGLDYLVRSEANELYETLHPYFEATVDTNILEAINRRIQSLPENIHPSSSFGTAPSGMVYNIGILLPTTEAGSGEWQVARSLYNGYHLAAEEFNRNHDDKQLRLHHIETSDTTLTQEAAMARLAWNHNVDVVIGPLFSNAAYQIGELAEFYQIPVIPPLANADTLNIDNPYLYQINPTFEARGRAMASFAVNELELDTVAVITQSNKPVTREAREFRNEAEHLGATVLHYFSKDFEARAFEVDDITPWFAGDERFIDEEEYSIEPVDGLYISVTGAGSEQLIELILNDLQAIQSDVTILGNEEMAHVELSSDARRHFDIYYSNFFHRNDDHRENFQFQNRFQSLAGFEPDNFAHLGYDVATFVFESLDSLQNPSRFKQYLRHRPLFEGVITNIDFRGSHINQHLHFFEVDRDETILYEPQEGEEADDDENSNDDS